MSRACPTLQTPQHRRHRVLWPALAFESLALSAATLLLTRDRDNGLRGSAESAQLSRRPMRIEQGKSRAAYLRHVLATAALCALSWRTRCSIIEQWPCLRRRHPPSPNDRGRYRSDGSAKEQRVCSCASVDHATGLWHRLEAGESTVLRACTALSARIAGAASHICSLCV